MAEENEKKLPLDARLLSEAVIELNILRRNVGLYPPSHAIIRNSITRTFTLLRKLLEVRPEITLGIARDTLIVDEYTLDRDNPVFKEFALSVHRKAIASVTFLSGVEEPEVVALHELLTMENAPAGRELLDYWASKGISHIRLIPIDFSTFRFVAGKLRKTKGGGAGAGEGGAIWEDYVYGLLEGRLAGGDDEAVLEAPPEAVAEIVNEAVDEKAGPETYDKVISAYLKKKSGESHLKSDTLNKFLRFIEHLKPEIKSQFLSRAFSRSAVSAEEMENTIKDMTEEEFERLAEIFGRNSSVIPTTLKNLMDKLSAIKKDKPFMFDMVYRGNAVFHDIEVGGGLERLFDDDHFDSFVSAEYQAELQRMLKASFGETEVKLDALRLECAEGVLRSVSADIMAELLDSPLVEREDYLKIVSKLTAYVNVFMETGSYEEILNVYNVIRSHALQGRNEEEAGAAVDYFFRSEPFINGLVGSFRFWARQNRDSSVRLAKALKSSMISPLLDALSEEQEAVVRKALLQVLIGLGGDILPDVVRRLDDKRWYVVRNMIYLIREAGGDKHLQKVRQFARHDNIRISFEAIRTLLHFGTADSVSYLRHYINSPDPKLRDYAVQFAGKFRMKGAVPELVVLLEKADLFGTESYFKIPVVKALGQIGDERAVPALLKLFKSRTLLYRGNLDELKAEIFRGLSNYPPASIKPLAEAGLKSKNGEIVLMSTKLLGRGGGK